MRGNVFKITSCEWQARKTRFSILTRLGPDAASRAALIARAASTAYHRQYADSSPPPHLSLGLDGKDLAHYQTSGEFSRRRFKQKPARPNDGRRSLFRDAENAMIFVLNPNRR